MFIFIFLIVAITAFNITQVVWIVSLLSVLTSLPAPELSLRHRSFIWPRINSLNLVSFGSTRNLMTSPNQVSEMTQNRGCFVDSSVLCVSYQAKGGPLEKY